MKIRLIVPNIPTFDVLHDRVQAYGREIAEIAGGFTATQATGGWIDGNGTLVVEPVTVFDCNVEPVNGSHYNRLAGFYRLAEKIAAELRQDCVYLEIDGEVEFVKP